VVISYKLLSNECVLYYQHSVADMFI